MLYEESETFVLKTVLKKKFRVNHQIFQIAERILGKWVVILTVASGPEKTRASPGPTFLRSGPGP